MTEKLLKGGTVMGTYFHSPSAVLLFLMRDGDRGQEVLLQKRQGTGYADGKWDFGACGHVEAGETMKAAMVREAQEELGIGLSPDALSFVYFMHKYEPRPGRIYSNIYFMAQADAATGTPTVMEPDKCGGLAWFALDDLPPDMNDDRRKALFDALNGVHYGEYGWDDLEQTL